LYCIVVEDRREEREVGNEKEGMEMERVENRELVPHLSECGCIVTASQILINKTAGESGCH